MPAAKLSPTGPRITAVPPVMYSQPFEPQPSTTASAPGVAHGEALAGLAGGEEPAGGRAVEHRVADDGVLLARRAATTVIGRTTMVPPESPLPT